MQFKKVIQFRLGRDMLVWHTALLQKFAGTSIGCGKKSTSSEVHVSKIE